MKKDYILAEKKEFTRIFLDSHATETNCGFTV